MDARAEHPDQTREAKGSQRFASALAAPARGCTNRLWKSRLDAAPMPASACPHQMQWARHGERLPPTTVQQLNAGPHHVAHPTAGCRRRPKHHEAPRIRGRCRATAPRSWCAPVGPCRTNAHAARPLDPTHPKLWPGSQHRPCPRRGGRPAPRTAQHLFHRAVGRLIAPIASAKLANAACTAPPRRHPGNVLSRTSSLE